MIPLTAMTLMTPINTSWLGQGGNERRLANMTPVANRNVKQGSSTLALEGEGTAALGYTDNSCTFCKNELRLLVFVWLQPSWTGCSCTKQDSGTLPQTIVQPTKKTTSSLTTKPGVSHYSPPDPA